jgi:autotransporter-associated beta strand protein
VPNLKPNRNFSLLLVSGAIISLCPEIGAQTREIFWGSHLGSEYLDQGDTTPGTIQSLFGLDAAGTNKASLVNGSADTSGDFTGDLIELGFFDADGVDDSSYTPNTDTSNPFKGIWTPLTSKTTIGRDWAGSGADLVGAGEFYFKTKFTYSPSVVNESSNNYGETFDFTDNLGDASASNDLTDRITALQGASSALLGIRFYDIDTSDTSAGGGGTTKATDGSTRYNTIMHTGAGTDWIWSSGFISLHNVAGTATDPDLVFEFENSSANAASKVGTGDNAIVSDDFTATVTYFDGSSNINVGDAGIGSSVFSGFDGTGIIYGGETDANIVTLHSQSGNTGSDAYEFSGDFYRAATGSDSTDLTILKTGTGDQILSGNLNLADSTDNASASGGINLAEGKLILKPGANSQIVEYLEGSGTLVLDNTGASNNIVTLGFANNTASSFSGNVELAGSGTEVKIGVSSGSTDDDYNNIQTISGVISGSEKLVKQGVGALKLNGTNSFDSDVEINGGRIIAASAQALGDTGNTIVINTGKLEVASGTTLNSGYTVQGDSDGSGRSFVGGDGTIGGSLTIGSANNEVDVIAPGEGLSTSINNDKKQAPRGHGGDSALAVGSFTVGTLTFNDGGVYDWEIDDFGGAAGTNWDLLNFTTLNLTDKTDTFTINVLGLDPTTDLSGSPNGDNLWSQGGTQWKFLEGTTINWGGGSQWSDAEIRSYFDVRFDDIAYQENMWGADWYVSYNSGAFYLQFSAVPEPSTYMMVTGLLMVPGMSYVRRFRKRKGSETVEEEPQI